MSARPVTVAFLSSAARAGGAERSLLELVRHLDRARFRPIAVLPERGPLEESLTNFGVPVVCVDAPREWLALGRESTGLSAARALLATPRLVGRVRGLARALAREGTGLVHANGIKASVLACALRSAGLAAPAVWHVRDFVRARRFFPALRLLAERHAAACIANSQATARDFAASATLERRTTVVLNPVDLDRFRPPRDELERARARAALGLAADQVAFGLASQLAPWKGQSVFLEALARARAEEPRIVGVLAGDEIYATEGRAGYRSELEARARTLGLGPVARFLGYVDDVGELLRGLDVAVHASTAPEPFGRVVAEGMSAALPVVASREGGVLELATPETALLLEPGDVAALAAAFVALARDPVRRARLGAAGRERALGLFRPEEHARRVQEVFESVLGRRASPDREP